MDGEDGNGLKLDDVNFYTQTRMMLLQSKGTLRDAYLNRRASDYLNFWTDLVKSTRMRVRLILL